MRQWALVQYSFCSKAFYFLIVTIKNELMWQWARIQYSFCGKVLFYFLIVTRYKEGMDAAVGLGRVSPIFPLEAKQTRKSCKISGNAIAKKGFISHLFAK
jgi:hypothetical protein